MQRTRHARQHPVPDPARGGRVLACEPRGRDEPRLPAVDRDAWRAGRGCQHRKASVELVREPQVAELAVHVREPPVEAVRVGTARRSEHVEVRHGRLRHARQLRRVVHAGGHDDDSRGGREPPEEQVHEQEVAEVVRGEGQLMAFGRALQAAQLKSRVADERSEREPARVDLLRQCTHRRWRREIHAQLFRAASTAHALEASHRLRRGPAIPARDHDPPARARERPCRLEADPGVSAREQCDVAFQHPRMLHRPA